MSYNQEAIGNHPYNPSYHQNNVYGNTQNITSHQSDGDAWNEAWGNEDNFNTTTKSQETNQSQHSNTGEFCLYIKLEDSGIKYFGMGQNICLLFLIKYVLVSQLLSIVPKQKYLILILCTSQSVSNLQIIYGMAF